jgi:hypothetical protein
MSDATNNPYTGSIAIVLFIAAHIVNLKFGRGTRWAYVALGAGIAASFLFYASTWATWAADKVSGAIDGFAGVPAHIIMSVMCLLALLVTYADLKHDPDYNNAVIWALLIGPVAAHGSSGWVHLGGEILYGGLTIVVQDLVAQLLGRFA